MQDYEDRAMFGPEGVNDVEAEGRPLAETCHSADQAIARTLALLEVAAVALAVFLALFVTFVICNGKA